MKIRTGLGLILLMVFAFTVVGILIFRARQVDNLTRDTKMNLDFAKD